MGSVGKPVEYTKFKGELETTGFLRGRAFKGDGSDVNQFFRDSTNNYDLIAEASMDNAAIDAFNSWAVGDFMDGQQYDGWDNMDREWQEKTRIYDSYLDRSVINKNFETRRLASAELLLGGGNYNITEQQLKELMNRTEPFLVKANMSTSAAPSGLQIGWGSHPVEYVFRFPKGSVGAGMWIGDSRINDEWDNRQREFMTNRDSLFKLEGYKRNEKKGVWEVTMKWVGGAEHDYGRE